MFQSLVTLVRLVLRHLTDVKWEIIDKFICNILWETITGSPLFCSRIGFNALKEAPADDKSDQEVALARSLLPACIVASFFVAINEFLFVSSFHDRRLKKS